MRTSLLAKPQRCPMVPPGGPLPHQKHTCSLSEKFGEPLDPLATCPCQASAGSSASFQVSLWDYFH